MPAFSNFCWGPRTSPLHHLGHKAAGQTHPSTVAARSRGGSHRSEECLIGLSIEPSLGDKLPISSAILLSAPSAPHKFGFQRTPGPNTIEADPISDSHTRQICQITITPYSLTFQLARLYAAPDTLCRMPECQRVPKHSRSLPADGVATSGVLSGSNRSRARNPASR